MDLAPGRSFLEWAVQHERTVFVISYRNADASMNGVTMDDYLEQGPRAALDVITDITGSATVDLVGLCIGGAMTAMTAAYLAQSEPDRIGTVTLLNTLLDYREPGALGVFTDEASVARLEQQMARSGFLDGEKMAGTFDVLRPNQLIFNYVVSNWLLGESPPAFDILAWNADTTRIPATLHASYLRSLYVDNLLAQGQLELAGCRLNLGDVTNDAYVVGAVNDHIVPWTASYEATQLLGGDVRYVLSSGGHIAGIVNPPGPKAWFEAATANPADAGDWRLAAERRTGTWWTDWDQWAAERAGPLVAPPGPKAQHPPLCDAPGDVHPLVARRPPVPTSPTNTLHRRHIMPAHSFTALTPLSFLQRSADVFADKTAIAYGERRLSYSEFGAEATPPGRRAAGLGRPARRPGRLHGSEHPGDAGGQLRRSAGGRGARRGEHAPLARGGPVRLRPLRREGARGRHRVPAGAEPRSSNLSGR